jgi:PHD/YefM family antitoxin component YafN of YafNO toxin-antitoxin module
MVTKAKAAERKKKVPSKQYVVDEKGRRTAVVLPIEVYEQLVEAAQDLEDIRAADEARAEGGEPVPLQQVEARLRAEGKLR